MSEPQQQHTTVEQAVNATYLYSIDENSLFVCTGDTTADVYAFCDLLKKKISLEYPQIVSLSMVFGSCRIGKSISAFTQFKNVLSLNVRGTHLDREGIRVVSDQMLNLTYLDIGDNNVGDEEAKIIANTPNKNLISVAARSNRIRCEGAKALARNTNFISLYLRANQIRAEGAMAFSESKTLIELELYSNCIGDEGAIALSQNSSLTYLEVDDNGLTDAAAIALAQNRTLQSLGIGCNTYISDTGAKALSENRTLRDLQIYSNRIGDTGGELFVNTETLLKLNMGNCNISLETANKFKQNKNLIQLFAYKLEHEFFADMMKENREMKRMARNRFILMIQKFYRHLFHHGVTIDGYILPKEMMTLIGKYLDMDFYVKVGGIGSCVDIGKSEWQFKQCMLYLFHLFVIGDGICYQFSYVSEMKRWDNALDYRQDYKIFPRTLLKATEHGQS